MKSKRSAIIGLALTAIFLQPLKAQTQTDSMAIVSAQWQITSTEDGIVRKCNAFPKLFDGPQYISIVEIDPAKGTDAHIAVSDSMTHTSRLAQLHHAVAAINGSYFDTKRGNSVCYLRVGKQVIDTTTADEFKLRITGAIHVHKGKLRILPWSKQSEQKYKGKRGTLLASGPLMLSDGKTCDWSACGQNFINTRHPRSAIATTADGKIWLITADGRAPGHAQGMSIPELAYFIRVLGGNNALNLDGGGSTTLWHDGQVVNHPSDNRKFDHEGERKVPNILYFTR